MKAYAIVVSCVLLVAVMVPVKENFSPRPVDSFPLSYYPMFSHGHPELQTFTYLLATGKDGGRSYVHNRYCEKGGMNQVRKMLGRLTRVGEAEQIAYLRGVAERLAQAEPERFDGLESISLVTGKFRPRDYFARKASGPESERVHAEFEIAVPSPGEFPGWMAEYARSLRWPEPAAELVDGASKTDREVLLESLRLGRDYLVNSQNDEGTFNYIYNFVTREVEPGESQIRQAGAVWGLALINYELGGGDPELLAAVERGLDFFCGLGSPDAPGGQLAIVYPRSNGVKTGTTALIALAAIEHLRADREGKIELADGRRRQVESWLDGLLEHLLFVQLGSGHFAESWIPGGGVPEFAEFNPYADGEALLALVKAAKYLGRDDLLPVVLETTPRLAKEYTVDAWVFDPDSDLTKGFFQWSCMALWEYQDAGWPGSEFCRDYLLAMGWWMINVHETLERRRNTAYAYEGMIPALDVARARGVEDAVRQLSATIGFGLAKLTSWQVGSPLQHENPLLAANPTDDRFAVGGVMNAVDEPQLRIDVGQHQMHAVILALRHIYREEAGTGS